MTNLKQYLIVGVLIIIILFLMWGGYSLHNKLKHYEEQIGKFEIGEQGFTEQVDTQGRQIVEQEQVILTQRQAVKHGLLEIDRLKKLKSQVKIISTTRIDSVLIPFAEVDSVFDTDTITMLPIPKGFGVKTQWYSLYGTIKKEGVLMDSVSFINDLRVSIGYKKQPFLKSVFKKPIPVVDIQNNNPYTNVTGLNNIVIEENKKFYQKRVFWFGVGFIGGALTISQIK